MRNRALLALSLPLAAVGSLAGHAAGYALVGTRRQDLHIHGYLSFAPEFVGLCLALVAVALVLRISGRLVGRPAAWPFALLPPLAFCAQELLERLLAGLPAHAVFEPAVYVGLAAQIPIGLLAFVAARALLRIADEAARSFAPRPAFTLEPTPPPLSAARASLARTPRSFDHLGRAPPRR